MNELQYDDKVKIQKKNEQGAWTEVGRGKIVGFSKAKNGSLFIKFIEFIEGKWSSLPVEFAETIPVAAPSMRVLKW